MPIFTNTPVRPNQQNQSGPIDALTMTEFTGMVEGTIARRAKLDPYIPRRTVKGTNSLTSFAVGETQLQALKPGVAPDGSLVSFSKASIVIDTVVLARNILPLLEVFQSSFDARKEIALEQGKKIAKFTDQAFMIAGIKTARMTASAFAGPGGLVPDGHVGGYKHVLATAGDSTDPAAIYAAVGAVVTKFQEKDIEPAEEGVIMVVRPAVFQALAEAEQISNNDYKTSEGNTLTGVPTIKAHGIPVISSNNLPNTVITGHLLSNVNNANAYDVDATKVVALFIAPRALLAGETIPLTTLVFWDDMSKQWYVDAWMSFAVGPHRAEFAATIELP